jgi:hypothetical protein
LSGDRDLSSRAFPVFVSDENYVFATVTRSWKTVDDRPAVPDHALRLMNDSFRDYRS